MNGAATPAARQPLEAGSQEATSDVKREDQDEDVTESSTAASNNEEKKPVHQEPAGECLVCFDTLEERNYVEYALFSPSCSPSHQDESGQSNTPEDDLKRPDAADSSANEPLSPTPRDEMRAQGEATGTSPVASIAPAAENLVWYPAKFCKDCIEELQAVQFQRYCDRVANTNCAREQRALLKRGPPVNLRDRMAFPESNDQEIHSLWFAADNKVRPAKLKDSLEGEKRQALWNWLEQFLIEDEQVVEDVNGKRTENS